MFGLFIENGLFEFDARGHLQKRNYTWSRTHNLIYIDNPVGTGFSFTGSDDGYAGNEKDVGRNLHEAVMQLYELFECRNSSGFWITGESYAGTFNFDDFKRSYSNEDESVSVPYFWQKFDPENYSIWFGEYKYNSELTKVFVSCNLITGMFQRLDEMRKQAFALVCLFGEDDDSTISGVSVWRGHELAFTLSPDWQIDYDCYAWKKLDANSEETKKLVPQYFSWTGTDKDGRKFNQGKMFK
ncbi:elongation factor 1-gamma-like [Eurosta solidaginis]|uniref:elongation factor 1-gamma-like n=1 Tax=Eurosta solidaginis TaxID=178769 RepID=UPI0035317842